MDPPEVGIPFGCGMSFPVSQVHNIGSHVGNDTWAWDFRMPEGTPVVAALDGVVRLARGDSDEGGCDPAMARKANYVVIESAGNIETQYLHFSAVSVIPGQPGTRSLSVHPAVYLGFRKDSFVHWVRVRFVPVSLMSTFGVAENHDLAGMLS